MREVCRGNLAGSLFGCLVPVRRRSLRRRPSIRRPYTSLSVSLVSHRDARLSNSSLVSRARLPCGRTERDVVARRIFFCEPKTLDPPLPHTWAVSRPTLSRPFRQFIERTALTILSSSRYRSKDTPRSTPRLCATRSLYRIPMIFLS